MPHTQHRALKRALKNQIRRLHAKADRLDTYSKRISTIRLLTFIGILVLIYLAARSGNPWILGIILLAGCTGFMGLISYHRKIDGAIAQFKGWAEIRKNHLARLNLDWDVIPSLPLSPKKYETHPFARDFNLVGKHSLLQLMNTTVYAGGTEFLTKWLLNRTPDIDKIASRQELVKELKPMAHFRDRLHLYANMAKKKREDNDWNMQELLEWLRSSQKTGFAVPLAILGGLATLNIILGILFLASILKPYVIISFAIYLLTYNFYSQKISGLFDEAYQLNKLLSQFRSVLLYLESFPYKEGSKLDKFCSLFHQAHQAPGSYLKRIIRLASAASSQSSELVWLLLNAVVPWDMYFAKKLNAYKKELEPKLSKWLDQFYRLEALNALANFAWLNPDYTFALPDQPSERPAFQAQKLGHPLIPKKQKVTNDVIIHQSGDILLITGSNMAGKSTFLRTLGINLCLCFAGGPVNAASLQTIPFRLFSSINVTDSLDEGLSHFYAEVKRLHDLLDELNKPHRYPLFYMVDEIYRGTNNRERLQGSAAFLKYVAGKDGIGLVSTHDLELAQLEQEITTLSNWHFEETIENGAMRFEYKLKAGPCPTTNALKIMEMEGLPVGND